MRRRRKGGWGGREGGEEEGRVGRRKKGGEEEGRKINLVYDFMSYALKLISIAGPIPPYQYCRSYTSIAGPTPVQPVQQVAFHSHLPLSCLVS